jgi:sulfite exporter TauE/SafE
MDPLLVTAFVLGLVSTAHCIGMCGPIALAIPLDRKNNVTIITGILQYNFGRILSYSIIGFIIGFIGLSVQLIGILQFLSIFSGVLIILFAYQKYWSKSGFQEKTPQFVQHFISANMGRILKSKHPMKRTFLGILNGFLPCGMVYAALITSLITAHPIQGATYMIFFGIGTLPGMILIAFSAQFVSRKMRFAFQKVSPYLIILIGVMLIFRGMNLGIPYLSPKFEINAETGKLDNTACHSTTYCPSPLEMEVE